MMQHFFCAEEAVRRAQAPTAEVVSLQYFSLKGTETKRNEGQSLPANPVTQETDQSRNGGPDVQGRVLGQENAIFPSASRAF